MVPADCHLAEGVNFVNPWDQVNVSKEILSNFRAFVLDSLNLNLDLFFAKIRTRARLIFQNNANCINYAWLLLFSIDFVEGEIMRVVEDKRGSFSQKDYHSNLVFVRIENFRQCVRQLIKAIVQIA